MKTQSEMRRLFEESVAANPELKFNTPLGIMEINGQFRHYMDHDTDTLWLGFEMGMRCAEKLFFQQKPE